MSVELGSWSDRNSRNSWRKWGPGTDKSSMRNWKSLRVAWWTCQIMMCRWVEGWPGEKQPGWLDGGGSWRLIGVLWPPFMHPSIPGPHICQRDLLKTCIRSCHIPAYIPSILRAKGKPRDCDTHITHSSLPSPTSVMSHLTTTSPPLFDWIYFFSSLATRALSTPLPMKICSILSRHGFLNYWPSHVTRP